MEKKTPNKVMFWSGMLVILVVSILLLMVEKDIPVFFGFFGILLIAASGYRPMKGET